MVDIVMTNKVFGRLKSIWATTKVFELSLKCLTATYHSFLMFFIQNETFLN
jgi:hypothetical protein